MPWIASLSPLPQGLSPCQSGQVMIGRTTVHVQHKVSWRHWLWQEKHVAGKVCASLGALGSALAFSGRADIALGVGALSSLVGIGVGLLAKRDTLELVEQDEGNSASAACVTFKLGGREFTEANAPRNDIVRQWLYAAKIQFPEADMSVRSERICIKRWLGKEMQEYYKGLRGEGVYMRDQDIHDYIEIVAWRMQYLTDSEANVLMADRSAAATALKLLTQQQRHQ